MSDASTRPEVHNILPLLRPLSPSKLGNGHIHFSSLYTKIPVRSRAVRRLTVFWDGSTVVVEIPEDLLFRKKICSSSHKHCGGGYQRAQLSHGHLRAGVEICIGRNNKSDAGVVETFAHVLEVLVITRIRLFPMFPNQST